MRHGSEEVVSRSGRRLAVGFRVANGHGAPAMRATLPAGPPRTRLAAAPEKKKAPEGAFNMLRLVRQAD
ncbi:hypothetical protein EMIT0111MI5_60420 [Burkholderia sp. IT-111MI5]